MFRISELAWVKVAPLSPVRWVVRIALAVCGVAFIYMVGSSKGSWFNVEGLLGLLALHVAWTIQGDIRLASTGDLEDSYDERGGGGDKPTFLNWVTALNETENELKVGRPDGPYFHWLNLRRIAWARRSPLVELYGLALIPVFLAYNWVLGQLGTQIKLPTQGTAAQIVEYLHLLTFNGGLGTIGMLCWLIAILGLAACLTSVRRAVEIRASGGLTDRLPMNAADQNALFDALAGNRVAENGKVKRAPAVVQAAPAPPVAAIAEPVVAEPVVEA